MDVDHGHAHAVEELRGEHLHVASQHDQIAAAVEQLELTGLGLVLAVLLDRHVVVGDLEQLGVGAKVGMVGDHHHDLRVELPRRQRHSRSSRQWS